MVLDSDSFFFMHFISGFILSVIFQTAHVVPESRYPLPDENGTIDYNWAILQLQTTSDLLQIAGFFPGL